MSELRCRAGDLAVIVRVSTEYHGHLIGRIIQVTEPYFSEVGACWAWRYAGAPLVSANGNRVVGIFDWELQPIRPSDEPAEILTLAGKPQEVVGV